MARWSFTFQYALSELTQAVAWWWVGIRPTGLLDEIDIASIESD
jgi:hypothetical protein